MRRLVTIGVYDFEIVGFLQRLRRADVRVLLDLRQRRGVRGPSYAWANARRLQAALAGAGIGYQHHRALAPTTELRRLQYAEDDRRGVGRRSRRVLAQAYRRRYTAEVLDQADLTPVLETLSGEGAVALLCVERDPEACHRSLVAQRLAERSGVAVEHLGLRTSRRRGDRTRRAAPRSGRLTHSSPQRGSVPRRRGRPRSCGLNSGAWVRGPGP